MPPAKETDAMATSPENLPRRHKLTVTDYYRLAAAGSLRENDRVELLDGEIIDMTPIGSKHAAKVGYLTQLLMKAVGDRALVWTQNPARLGIYSEPQPDLMLLRPKTDFYASGHPVPEDILLIVEVADTSLKYDRDTKIPLYARHGIREVWLVDIDNERLAIYRQPGPEGYGAVSEPASPERTSLVMLPDLYVDLGDLF
ncbi:MAG TPA: Uma2 family endonuclease [Woeseiaceae bacterium]|nr:Uma2 family endonuclease [Woeseiaceae bacterium]